MNKTVFHDYMYEWIKAKPVRFECTFYILVDKEDLRKLNQYEWFVKRTHTYGTYYAFTYIDGKQISMHQLIMNPDEGYVVHHQDGVGLHNFKANLKNLKGKEHLEIHTNTADFDINMMFTQN